MQPPECLRMMRAEKVILKLGGSLLEAAPELLKQLYSRVQDTYLELLIVPGGGPFANLVRSLDMQHGLGEDAAHWMAVLAMEQYAWYLMDRTGLPGTTEPEACQERMAIVQAYRPLQERDELEHCWDVTSDTIAAWFAYKCGARFIKVTDVDGVLIDGEMTGEISAAELEKMGTTCADIRLPAFLKRNKMDCLVINGKYPERVWAGILGLNVKGTLIKGNI